MEKRMEERCRKSDAMWSRGIATVFTLMFVYSGLTSAFAVDVDARYNNSDASSAAYHDDSAAPIPPTTTGMSSNPGTWTRQADSYKVVNDVLYRATVTVTTSNRQVWDSGLGQYVTVWDYNTPSYSWQVAPWSANNNTVDIRSNDGRTMATHGDGEGTAGTGITGSGNTVNVSGTDATNQGTITGTVNLHTDNNNGNTFGLGYLNGAASSGGTVAGSGTVNVGYGNINIHDGVMAGTVTANTNQVTTASQDGGSVTGNITIRGDNSTYDMSAGTITGNGRVDMSGDTTHFTQDGTALVQGNARINISGDDAVYDHDGTRTIGTAQVTMSGERATYNQVNGASLENTARVNMTNDDATYNLEDNSFITDSAQVNMSGDSSAPGTNAPGAVFNQRDTSSINTSAQVNMSGDDARYIATGGTITDNAQINMSGDGTNTGVGAVFDNTGTLVNGSAKVNMSGEDAIVNIYENGHVTGNAQINFTHNNGGVGTLNLYDNDPTNNGVIDGNAIVTMENGGNTFNHFGTANGGLLAGNAEVNMDRTLNGEQPGPLPPFNAGIDGENVYNLYDNGRIGIAGGTDTVTINMTNGRATFNVDDDATISASTTINMSRDGSVNTNTFNQQGDSFIQDQTIITMSGGGNRFQQHQQAQILDDVRVTMHGGYNSYLQSNTASINDDAIIIQNGGNNYYQQDLQSTINDRVQVTQNNGSNRYFIYDTASVNNNAVITQNGGSNTMRQYGDGLGLSSVAASSLNDDASVRQNGGNNNYLLYDAASVNDRANITQNGGSNTFQQYDVSTINDTAWVEMNGYINTITGQETGNNLYQQYGQSSINTSAVTLHPSVTMNHGRNEFRQYGDSTINNVSSIVMNGGLETNGGNTYGANLYQQYDNAAINDNSTVTMNDGRSEYRQYGDSSVNDNVAIEMNGYLDVATGNTYGENLYRQFDNAEINNDSTVTMNHGKSEYRQYGDSSINNNSAITIDGWTDVATGSIRGDNLYQQYDNAAINDNTTVDINGGYNLYRQFGDSTTNDDVVVTMTGSYDALSGNTIGNSRYQQYDNAQLNHRAQVIMDDGYNHRMMYDDSEINDTATVTMNGYTDVATGALIGNNLYQQFGDSIVQTNDATQATQTITMNGRTNIYQQFGNATVTGDSVVTLNNDDSLYELFAHGIISDNAEINLITGNQNRFHMYDHTLEYGANPALAPNYTGLIDQGMTDPRLHDVAQYQGGDSQIIDNARVNLNQDNSSYNHVLIDTGTISSVGKGGDTNVININGDDTYFNVYTQRGGRVSTAPLGSNSAGAGSPVSKINLNGERSTVNIFELGDFDRNADNVVDNYSYNDFDVLMGSSESKWGVYHQLGGRKDANVDITGSHNLFWLNGHADYNADATINSGNLAAGFTGSNMVVVDIGDAFGSHSRPSAIDHASHAGDAINWQNPGSFGTIDLSGTLVGENNLFFANGDVYGTVTTSGNNGDLSDSQSRVFIGFTTEPDYAGYSWYKNDEYNLSGLLGVDEITNNPDPHGGPKYSPYFSLARDVNETRHLNVRDIVGGGGELYVQVTAGNVYNLKGRDAGVANDVITNSVFSPSYAGNRYKFTPLLPIGYDAVFSPIYRNSETPAPGEVTSLYSQFQYTTDFSNHNDYQVYSLLNQDAVNVGAYVDYRWVDDGTGNMVKQYYIFHSPTNVTVGAIKDKSRNPNDPDNYNNSYDSIDLGGNELMPGSNDVHTVDYYENGSNYGPHEYGDFYKPGQQAQITAGMVNVYAGSKLTLHENVNAMGTDGTLLPADQRNIIDNLNIIGMPTFPANCEDGDCGYFDDAAKQAIVTIDRTTIHTLTEGSTITHYETIANAGAYNRMYDYNANVIVGTNGILQGFGEITDIDDHTPLRPNVIGDVAVLSGGMIRPYDAGRVNPANPNDKGIFVVHGNALQYNAGTDPNDLYGASAGQRADYTGANFEENAKRLKGMIMKVDGTTTFEHSSRFSTRLFADVDDSAGTGGAFVDIISSDGTDTDVDYSKWNGFTPKGEVATVNRYWGDSLESAAFNFEDLAYTSIYLQNGVYNLYTPAELATGYQNGVAISADYYKSISDKTVWQGVSQANKVQYTPTFGFVNELKSKLEHEIYWGKDESGYKSYYYEVAYGTGGATINELVDMPDANHLFNRDILFSDMLGSWSFEKQADNSGVVLRYRQLAKHPQEGGIAIDQEIFNSREVGKKLDEIRYPFFTPTNMADSSLDGLFIADPSLDGSRVIEDGTVGGYKTPYDINPEGVSDPANPNNYYAYDGNPYDTPGFDGNIETYYRQHQDRFTGYTDYYVHDIDVYLRALQLETYSQDSIHRALRLISAEPYASQASADLSTMNSFIASRERNGQSALWLVEKKKELVEDPDSEFQRPLERDMPTEFVDNPVRIWATALGNRSRQSRVGDEYGYRSQSYGIQIGGIKEYGDMYVGLTGGYSRVTNRWAELQAKNKSDSYMGEALLGFRRGLGFMELSAHAGYMDNSMDRDITLGKYLNDGAYNPALDCNLADNYYNGVYSVQHNGDYKNRILGGGIRFGYQKVFADKWLFLPTLAVRYQDIRNAKSFVEDGPYNSFSKFDFNKGGIQRQSLRIPFMLHISRGFAFNDGGPTILTPELRLGATYEALDRRGMADFKWVGNPIPERWMVAKGIKEDRMSYQLGATIEVSRRGRFYAALNYDLEYWSKSLNHNFSIQTGFNF